LPLSSPTSIACGDGAASDLERLSTNEGARRRVEGAARAPQEIAGKRIAIRGGEIREKRRVRPLKKS
jgi:hypothetical protein